MDSQKEKGQLKFYCDNQRHLVCVPYSVSNLHRMAKELGIKRCWYHATQFPHYDIPKRRIEEIQAKCQVVRQRVILDIVAHRKRKSMCNATVAYGEDGAELSRQSAFPPTTKCIHCDTGEAILTITVAENETPFACQMYENDPHGEGYWYHDAASWALYTCRDCLEVTVLWNQS